MDTSPLLEKTAKSIPIFDVYDRRAWRDRHRAKGFRCLHFHWSEYRFSGIITSTKCVYMYVPHLEVITYQ
jgi:hypothetical protein